MKRITAVVTAIAILVSGGIAAHAQDDAPPPETIAAEAAPTEVIEPAAEASEWPELIPTSAFAGRSAFRSAKISPDGSKLAVQTNVRGRAMLAIFDAATRDLISSSDIGRTGWMNWFRWAGSDRILISIDGNGNSTSKRYLMTGRWTTSLLVHELSTNRTEFIGFKEQGFEGDDILHIDPAGEYIVLSMSRRVGGDPYVYRFPLDGTGESGAVLLQDRRKSIDEWWADDQGVVRLGLRHEDRGNFAWFYRGSADEEWLAVAKVDKDELAEVDNWDVLSIRAGSDLGYALVKDTSGRKVLREFNYRTGTAGKILYAHPTRDVEGVRFDADGTLTAATYVDDEPGIEWFDPKLKRAQSELEGTLTEGRVRLSTFEGTERMLVYHGGASDPGAMYIYTPSARTLDLFSEYRPNVDFQQLVDVQVISYQARDGTPIEGYLTLPNWGGRTAPEAGHPMIIMPHGGPFGVRDSRTYDDQVQVLANRGYAVLQPNFRGSGGYGQRFEDLGIGQIGRAMQDDLDDAMDWAVAQGHADPARVCVVGGSYGGFASLWAVIRNPERYRCAASWAGVTDFREQLKYDKDYLDRRVGKRWRGRVQGEQRTAALDAISPTRQIARLTRPVLIAHGTRDGRVPFSQFFMFREAAEKNNVPIETLVIENEGHGFSGKHNERKWYDTLLEFLTRHNPSDRPPPPPREDDGRLTIKRVDSM